MSLFETFLWQANRTSWWLMSAGFYTIIIGLFLFVCGLCFLFVYGRKELKSGNKYPLKRSLISLAILLFNFPAAALILLSVEHTFSSSVATVINHSPFEITDMVLIERDKFYRLPPIAASQRVKETFYFKYYEGAIDYKLTINGSPKSGVMFGYVTSGMGETATMIITKEGNIEVKR